VIARRELNRFAKREDDGAGAESGGNGSAPEEAAGTQAAATR